MKSRTSFFNGTVLRKDITRYAPVWALYTIALFLFMVVTNLGDEAYNVADVLASTSSSLSVINLILAGIVALLVFGDLFKTRLCYATHALPLRREGWFLTHFTAGLLFSLVPNLLLCLCMLPMVMPYWYMPLVWLASNTLQYLFFFGVGAFCAACAGNRLGMAAAYAIMNFGVTLISWYAEDIYTPLLYGMEFQWGALEWFMPVSRITSLDVVEYTRRPFTFGGCIPGDWLYLGIIAGVGIVLAVLAVLIYRKRHMETAGDFLSLKAAKPVFLLIYTLAVAYIFHLVIDFWGLFAGLIVGFFTGKMLLNRTVRVFKGWNFLQLGILITAMLLSMFVTLMDPAGLTRYVPDTKNVEAMYFCSSGDSHIYLQDEDQVDRREIRDPAEIDRFRQFHEEVCDGRYEYTTEETTIVYLRYELKSGMSVRRRYEIPVASSHSDFVQAELSDWKSVFHINDWESFASGVEQLELEIELSEQIGHFTLTDPVQIRGLLDAVKADCDAGNMAQNWSLHQDDETAAWLYIYDGDFYTYNESVYGESVEYVNVPVYAISLNIYDSCTNTLAYIDSLDLDYTPYEK